MAQGREKKGASGAGKRGELAVPQGVEEELKATRDCLEDVTYLESQGGEWTEEGLHTLPLTSRQSRHVVPHHPALTN